MVSGCDEHAMDGTEALDLNSKGVTLPETNGEFTPENGWLEYDSFRLGRLGLFSGAKC